MMLSGKIIVSMTSYPGRIDFVGRVIYSLYRNTRRPDLIVCNLSRDEFVDREHSLPEDLQVLLDNGVFVVNWLAGNDKQFKKIIPSLEQFPDDIIISVDDDILYPIDFIDTIYKDYIHYGGVYPITCGTHIDKGYYYGKPSHHGSFSLVTRSMFGSNFERMLELVHTELWKNLWFDDPLYTYAILGNGLEYKMGTWDGYSYKKRFVSKGVSSHNSGYREREHLFLKRFFKCM